MLKFLFSILVGLGLVSNPFTVGNVVNNTPALFETSLASAMGTSDTSLTLVSGTLRDGTSLTGNICLTIDSGLTNTEYVCGTASSTSVTGLTRGIGSDGFTSYAALKFTHRYGADVKVTDFPALQQLSQYVNGAYGLPNPIQYATSVTTSSISNNQYLASKGYVDSVAFSGAPNGSLTQKGIYQEATKAQTVAGTAVGSTGADLVVPNSYFSNTPSATATVPVTDSDGTLPTGFVKQTASSSYNFLGNMNFASTTNSGTSTIQNAKINNNLVVSGNATLSGVNSGNFPNLISASTTNVTNNGTNETNIFSVSIPGGTLLTGNVIKAETTLEYVTRFTPVSNFILRLKYGSTNIATSTISLTSGNQKPAGKLFVELFSAGTTSSQEANMFYLFPETTPTSTITWNSRLVGTSAEDSTTAKNLTLSMEVSGANDVVTAYNWYVAKLIQ